MVGTGRAWRRCPHPLIGAAAAAASTGAWIEGGGGGGGGDVGGSGACREPPPPSPALAVVDVEMVTAVRLKSLFVARTASSWLGTA